MSHSKAPIPPQPGAIPAYRGRFAPSPTGPLHFGSLVSALGSYLAARAAGGAWLVRIEDVDAPRTVAGAADAILRTLEALGLGWDETVLYQSRRGEAYRAAVGQLQRDGFAYPCTCSRREIADSALRGIEGQVYPGTCRNGPAANGRPQAWRVRTDGIAFPAAAEGTIEFIDALQGRVTQHLASEVGDFVVWRADGLFAYQLAVAVDDAFQAITHVVRGADLLASTARQIHLQRLLGLPTPAYMHLPVAVNAAGEKLSKQTLAAPVEASGASAALVRALHFLRQRPLPELAAGGPREILEWGVAHWDPRPMSGIQAQPE